jgi:hypothetical protein
MMDDDAVLAASPGSCRKRPPSHVGEGHHRSTRRRESPLNPMLLKGRVTMEEMVFSLTHHCLSVPKI